MIREAEWKAGELSQMLCVELNPHRVIWFLFLESSSFSRMRCSPVDIIPLSWPYNLYYFRTFTTFQLLNEDCRELTGRMSPCFPTCRSHSIDCLLTLILYPKSSLKEKLSESGARVRRRKGGGVGMQSRVSVWKIEARLWRWSNQDCRCSWECLQKRWNGT